MVATIIRGAMGVSPAWIDALLTEKFFGACSKHGSTKKNERNVFCVECSGSICQHCLGGHSESHRLVQVRRYVYQDVIRLHDMEKLLKCELVQTYTINSAKVVFLKPRPQSRPAKGLSNSCETCERHLQESYCYCSIACKVEALVRQKQDLAACLIPTPGSVHESEDVFTVSPAESFQRPGVSKLEEDMSEGDSTTTTSSSGSGTSVRKEFAQPDQEVVVVPMESPAPPPAPTFALLLPPPKRSRSSRCGASSGHHCPSPKSVIAHCLRSARRKGVPHRSPFI